MKVVIVFTESVVKYLFGAVQFCYSLYRDLVVSLNMYCTSK